jgi:hypothetical protein
MVRSLSSRCMLYGGDGYEKSQESSKRHIIECRMHRGLFVSRCRVEAHPPEQISVPELAPYHPNHGQLFGSEMA